MAVINPPGWLQNAGATHTAAQMRSYLAGLLAGKSPFGTDFTKAIGGVHPVFGSQLAVTQNGTPNMSVNVAAGAAFIVGTEDGHQGMYFTTNDASVNLSIATAPGTGLNRIDLVVFQVRDSFYSGANNDCQLAVVTGTAAASPSAPAAPNNSVILAQVFVGANVTSIVSGNITDTRTYIAGNGGVILCRTVADINSGRIPQGQFAWEITNTKLQLWDGAAWNWLNAPKGYITEQFRTTATGTFTTTETAVQTATWTALAGVRYKLTAMQHFSSSVAGDLIQVQIKWQAGASLTPGSATSVLSVLPNADVASKSQPITMVSSFVPGAGQVTAGITMVRNAGTGNIQSFGSAQAANSILIEAI